MNSEIRCIKRVRLLFDDSDEAGHARARIVVEQTTGGSPWYWAA